jgi:hypothetical protein
MEQTDQLLHHISTAEGNTTQIESDVKALDTELNTIHDDLAVSKTVNDSLHLLDDSLTTASQLLAAVAAIPSISQSASDLKKVVDAYHTPIQQAVKDSDAVEKIVAPIRIKIEQLEPKVAILDKTLLVVMLAEAQFINTLGSAEQCINSLPDSDIKTKLDQQMDAASSSIDPAVLKFDGVQVAILTTLDKAKQLADQIKTWAENLLDLNLRINSVINILKPLIDALQAVADAFKQTIRVPYGGYPKTCYKKVFGHKIPYPCGWVTVYYSFTIQQILDGATGMIKPIVDLLEAGMNEVLKPLLRNLGLDSFTLPAIPGLDVLTQLTSKLQDTFDSIAATLEALINQQTDFNTFMAELKKILDAMSEINIQCQLNTPGQKS